MTTISIYIFYFQFKEPEGFQEGMKVEAVDPENQSNICVSTIVRAVGGHLWLHIDGDTRQDQIYAYNSYDVFPAGWCESTGHELQWPRPESKFFLCVYIIYEHFLL